MKAVELIKSATVAAVVVASATLFGPTAIAQDDASNPEPTSGIAATDDVTPAPEKQSPNSSLVPEVSGVSEAAEVDDDKIPHVEANTHLAPEAATSTSVALNGSNRVSPNAIDTSSRAAVQQAFMKRYVANDVYVSPNTHNPNDPCDAGQVNPILADHVEGAWNFFRGLNGLDAVVINSASTLAPYPQNAAMMMAHHGSLSHFPTKDWKCWNRFGSIGAAASNLSHSRGQSPAEQILWYFIDWSGGGESTLTANGINDNLGHRIELLNPFLTSSAYGSYDGYNAITVGGYGVYHNFNARSMLDMNATAPETFSWPSAGYFPAELLTSLDSDSKDAERWSFSIRGADFSNASASITGPDGRTVKTTFLRPKSQGEKAKYAPRSVQGYNTILLKMPKITDLPKGSESKIYTVRVTGVKGTGKSTYSYQVKLFNANVPSASSAPSFPKNHGSTFQRESYAFEGYGSSPAKLRVLGDNLKFQWQRSDNGGKTWTDIHDTYDQTHRFGGPNDINYAPSYGACKDSHRRSMPCPFTSPQQAEKYSFRLKASNSHGTAYSDPMKVTYISFTQKPPATAKVGQTLHMDTTEVGNGDWFRRTALYWTDNLNNRLAEGNALYLSSSLAGKSVHVNAIYVVASFGQMYFFYPEASATSVR